MLGDALGLPLEQVFGFNQDFGCINLIDYSPTRTRVALINHSSMQPWSDVVRRGHN